MKHEVSSLVLSKKHFKSVIWYIGETCDTELCKLKGRRTVVWPDSGPVTDETLLLQKSY